MSPPMLAIQTQTNVATWKKLIRMENNILNEETV